MNWSETRKKLLKLASGRRPSGGTGVLTRPAGAPPNGVERRNGAPPPSATGPDGRVGVVRPASLCIASGKGGTGKSVVTASLASLFAARGRTLLVDADLGVGNAHILQDVSPPASFVEVVEGSRAVRDVVVPCGGQVDLLAAGSGVPRMVDLSSYELHLIAAGLEELEGDYRYLLTDSAAGISHQTISFAQVSDVVLLVTTPDLTAMTDAYAFVKVLFARAPKSRALLLVNRAEDEEEAREVADRIGRVCRRFLGRAPRSIGWLPNDPVVTQCVNRRGPTVVLEPHAPFSYGLRRVSVRLLEELAKEHHAGLGRRLLHEVGYPARMR